VDRRIQTALPMTTTFGLAELLANGPELARDWEAAWEPGNHPRGAALVAAAVDCRRAGLHEPVPADLLDRLAAHYLADRGGEAALRPEPLDAALRWATEPARGASSLLLPAAGTYLAFDYLIDVPADVVPRPVWTDLVEWADPEQAMRIGLAARGFARFDVAESAFDKAAAGGVAGADIEYADAIGASDLRLDEAVDLLTRALASLDRSDSGTLRVRGLLARYMGAAGDDDAAEMFAKLLVDSRAMLGPDHPDTLAIRCQAAIHVGRTESAADAARLLAELVADQERVSGPEHLETFRIRHLHAIWTFRAGDPETALDLLDVLLADRIRAQGPEHPNVLSTRFHIAVSASNVGRTAEALALLQELLTDSIRVLGETHPHTISARYRLALCARDLGQVDVARRELTVVHEEHMGRFGPEDSRATWIREQLDDLEGDDHA
jgi:tetratricopeptide (TPR) repeat protein